MYDYPNALITAHIINIFCIVQIMHWHNSILQVILFSFLINVELDKWKFIIHKKLMFKGFSLYFAQYTHILLHFSDTHILA